MEQTASITRSYAVGFNVSKRYANIRGGGFKPNGKIIDKMYDYSNWNGNAINVVSFDLILFVFHFIDVVQAHYG